MSNFDVAHIREQGQQMIIVPLNSNFHFQTPTQRQATIDALQACARSARLAGRVVPVWLHAGSMYFIAPSQWRPFFQSLSWNDIMANINGTLTCTDR
ncbi:hypothetical protein [Deinococcus sonorensis]|uniref:Uncharacterized protein n=2 Tax=Deinococcus sonorensis TaxID=309891 RepID=A0AAU7UGQ3_9DEIO